MVCFTIHKASLWERRFLVSRYMRRAFHRYGIVRQAENKSALGVYYNPKGSFIFVCVISSSNSGTADPPNGDPLPPDTERVNAHFQA